MNRKKVWKKVVGLAVLICGFAGASVALPAAATTEGGAPGDGTKFSVLYAFEAPAPTTFTSPLGSQPDTLPALGPGNAVYGMAYDGGKNGTGVVYRFNMHSHQYTPCCIRSAPWMRTETTRTEPTRAMG